MIGFERRGQVIGASLHAEQMFGEGSGQNRKVGASTCDPSGKLRVSPKHQRRSANRFLNSFFNHEDPVRFFSIR